MRRKAQLYLKKDTNNIANTNNSFKTKNYPSQCKELQNFKKDFLDTIKLQEIKKIQESSRQIFQRKLKKNISNIKALPDVYVFHAKTTNIYELPPKDYKRLLNENITKSSEKSPTRLEKSKNSEAKKIGKGIKQDD